MNHQKLRPKFQIPRTKTQVPSLSPRVKHTNFPWNLGYYLFFLIFLPAFYLQASGQNSKAADARSRYIDSLTSVLKIAKDDSGTVTTLNLLFDQYEFSDVAKAKEYLIRAIALSKKIDFKRGLAGSYMQAGFLAEDTGNYQQAIINYRQTIKVLEQINDKVGIARANNNIGNIFARKGNYPEALQNYIAALRIKEELGDKHGLAIAYGNIGNIYCLQLNYADAIKNYSLSLKMYNVLGDKQGIADAYGNIGYVQSAQKNYSEAMKNETACLAIRKELQDNSGIANAYHDIGDIYKGQGDSALVHGNKDFAVKEKYPAAMENYLLSVAMNEELGNKNGIASASISLGLLNIKLKNLAEARKYLDKALFLSKEIGTKDEIRDSYFGLSQLDSMQGNWKGAYEHHMLYMVYDDSLNNEEISRKMTQASMQYEFDKKQTRERLEQEKKDAITKAELKRRKLLIFAISIGFALLMIIAAIILRSLSVTRRQKKIIEKEKQRSDKLLLNILPSKTAEELKQFGSAEPKQYEMVTVLFTDFKGFTKIAEKMTPKELVAELNYIFTKFDEIISKYPIEKIKTIGDSYMCAGGLPISNNTNPVDLVSAALEIRQFMMEDKAKKEKEGKPAFEIRIGLHSGPIVAGIVGISKFSYDIWGDTVNTASRMESSGEPGQINISEATYNLIKDKFDCTYRGKIAAKNKGEIGMYFVNN